MGKLSNVGKAIIIGAIAIIAVIIIVLVITNGNNNTTTTDNNATSSPSALMTASTTPTSTQTAAATMATVKKSVTDESQPSPSPTIHIITPVKNDVWTIGVQNPISWDKAGNFTGSLSLINAATGEFVGTILPEVGSSQTSYTWNTVSVAVSRSNPAGKDVVPGTYEIELIYDGNNIKPVFSPVFSIIN